MIAGSGSLLNKMTTLDGHVLADIKSIFSKHGTTIERIILKDCFINIANLMELLSFTPKVHRLEFVKVFAKYSRNSSVQMFELQNVKSLTILYCSSTLQLIASTVAKGVLESFTFTSEYFYSLDLFLSRQKNIASLFLHNLKYNNAIVQAHSFKDHKLSELSLVTGSFGEKRDALKNIIEQQAPYLKNLDLSGSLLDNKTFECITQLANLEILAVNINGISPIKMFCLQHLQQLQKLTIIMNRNVDQDNHFDCFSKIILKMLTKLEIKFPMIQLSSKTFVKLGENLQSLKHLYIDCDLNFDVIAVILSNFSGLKTLVLRDVKALNTKKILNLNDYLKYHNSSLSQLSLFVDISASSLPSILCIELPVLQALEIQSKDNTINIVTMILGILHNFTNLKELSVDNKNSIDLSQALIEFLQHGASQLHVMSVYVTNLLEDAKNLLLGFSNRVYLEGERLTVEFNF